MIMSMSDMSKGHNDIVYTVVHCCVLIKSQRYFFLIAGDTSDLARNRENSMDESMYLLIRN